MPLNGVSEISGRVLPVVPHVFTFMRGTSQPRAKPFIINSGSRVEHRLNKDDGPEFDRAAHGLHTDPGTRQYQRTPGTGKQEEDGGLHRYATDRMTDSYEISLRKVHGCAVCWATK